MLEKLVSKNQFQIKSHLKSAIQKFSARGISRQQSSFSSSVPRPIYSMDVVEYVLVHICLVTIRYWLVYLIYLFQ